jgi:redox-sensitive bicupin YhaK (pirin superfamily)
MLSEWLYVEVRLEPTASAPLDPDQEERAIYVVEGEVYIAGETFEAPRLLIFRLQGDGSLAFWDLRVERRSQDFVLCR